MLCLVEELECHYNKTRRRKMSSPARGRRKLFIMSHHQEVILHQVAAVIAIGLLALLIPTATADRRQLLSSSQSKTQKSLSHIFCPALNSFINKSSVAVSKVYKINFNSIATECNIQYKRDAHRYDFSLIFVAATV